MTEHFQYPSLLMVKFIKNMSGKNKEVSKFIHEMNNRKDVVSVEESGDIINVYITKPVSEMFININLNESTGKVVKLIPPMHG